MRAAPAGGAARGEGCRAGRGAHRSSSRSATGGSMSEHLGGRALSSWRGPGREAPRAGSSRSIPPVYLVAPRGAARPPGPAGGIGAGPEFPGLCLRPVGAGGPRVAGRPASEDKVSPRHLKPYRVGVRPLRGARGTGGGGANPTPRRARTDRQRRGPDRLVAISALTWVKGTGESGGRHPRREPSRVGSHVSSRERVQ